MLGATGGAETGMEEMGAGRVAAERRGEEEERCNLATCTGT